MKEFDKIKPVEWTSDVRNMSVEVNLDINIITY